jgi:hypothetical protein
MEVEKTEEDILKTRFIVKDSTLSNLVRKFKALSALLASDNSEKNEECEAQYQAFLQELAVYEHQLLKAKVVLKTAERESKTFDVTNEKICRKIESTKVELAGLKTRLHKEQAERSHREEYVALSKLINQLPTRQETQGRIDAQKAEIAGLEEEKGHLDAEMRLKRKQFALFLHSLKQLQSVFRPETK